MVVTVSFFSSSRRGIRESPESWHEAQRCWNTASPETAAAESDPEVHKTAIASAETALAGKRRAHSLEGMRNILQQRTKESVGQPVRNRTTAYPSPLIAHILITNMEAEMHLRNLTFAGAVSVFLSLLLLVGLTLVGGQAIAQSIDAKTAKTATGSYTPPRTPDGHPDLQGIWANNNATPLERPKELAGREFLTEQEVAALKSKADELFSGEGDAAFGDTVFSTVLANVKGTKSGFKSTDGGTGDYSSVWTVKRDWNNRTSLITDPPDGRLPEMTPEGQARRDANTEARNRPPAGPEDRALQERCITYGSPSLVAGYQSGYQIVQTPTAVAVMTEMIHDTRVIPLDARPALPPGIHQWLGNSRGHWEGDTLVIETANYKPRSFMSLSSEKLHVTERFSRTGAEDLKYEITINDPGTWTKPWSLMIPLKRSSGPLFEYACHEGNYGLEGILAGARAEEKAGQAAQKPGK
jgi:hypothetical protein